MKKIKKAFVYSAEALVHLFSYCTIRSKKTWVFGAWTGKLYSDNPKCVFEYVSANHPEIKAMWISRDKDLVKRLKKEGIRAAYYHSLKGVFTALRASLFFTSEGVLDVPSFCIGKAKVIQLWHGMGIKEVGKNSGWQRLYQSDKKPSLISRLYTALRKHENSHYEEHIWMAASEEARAKYSAAFDVPTENFIITGQPKDDLLAVEKENSYVSEIRAAHPGAKIAVYLPTHRNFGRKSDISDVMSIENLQRVNRMLSEKNIVMIFKPHFHEFEKYAGYEGTLGNVVFATDKEKFGDVYEFLPACDMMITDYSGIMFGYLASGKPIVYFPYDYEEYVSGDAGFCYDYYDITYGPICKTWEEVVSAMATITPEDYAELREKQRARFCPHADGKNCERVYQATLDIIKK